MNTKQLLIGGAVTVVATVLALYIWNKIQNRKKSAAATPAV